MEMKRFIISIFLCAPLLASAITAKAYIAIDEHGHVLAQSNPDSQRPIASITKLFTGAKNIDLPKDELITITADDVRNGRMYSTPLRAGKSYSRGKLLELTLVNSDNVAAIALGRTSNAAIQLPENTTYVEASGLNPNNRSTPRAIAEYANSFRHTDLAKLSIQPTVSVDNVVRKNTNPLIGKPGWQFYLTKTGFINPSGGCLVVITKINDKIVTVAILGSADTRQRWRDLAELRAKLGDSNFHWPQRPQSPKPKRKHK